MAPQDQQPASGSGGAWQPDAIQDRRPKPRGVLPRQLQMWLMAGIALVILVIILVTGHAVPPPPTSKAEHTAPPTMATADRIRSYQQQLAAEDVRQRQAIVQEASAARPSEIVAPAGAPASDPIADEQRRRDYQSLFSDNIALSHRPNRQPSGENGQPRPFSGPMPSVPWTQA